MASAGPYTVTYLHGFFCFMCCIIIVMFIPETKGKSLEEIQEFFEAKALTKQNKNNERNIEENVT